MCFCFVAFGFGCTEFRFAYGLPALVAFVVFLYLCFFLCFLILCFVLVIVLLVLFGVNCGCCLSCGFAVMQVCVLLFLDFSWCCVGMCYFGCEFLAFWWDLWFSCIL